MNLTPEQQQLYQKLLQDSWQHVLTPPFTLRFSDNLFNPKAPEGGGEPRYSMAMIFEKSQDLTELKVLCMAALYRKYPDGRPPSPSFKAWPIKDGTERVDKQGKFYAGFGPNVVFANAKSKFAPQILNESKEHVHERPDLRGQIYDGCVCVAALVAYDYNNTGNSGIGFGLRGIMKIRDGERLGGGEGPNIDEIFANVQGQPSGMEHDPFGQQQPPVAPAPQPMAPPAPPSPFGQPQHNPVAQDPYTDFSGFPGGPQQPVGASPQPQPPTGPPSTSPGPVSPPFTFGG